MKKLKRLALALALTSVLAASAVADETNSTPCAPGETHSPPCISQSGSADLTALGETAAPPASDTSVAVTDITEAVMWALSLF